MFMLPNVQLLSQIIDTPMDGKTRLRIFYGSLAVLAVAVVIVPFFL